jgi:lipopolysaccharide export system ATP-binding protein
MEAVSMTGQYRFLLFQESGVPPGFVMGGDAHNGFCIVCSPYELHKMRRAPGGATPDMPHTLTADGIQLQFGDRKVLTDIYLCCETSRITGLLGGNGQGKSSLMNIMYGTLRAYCSCIRIDGVNLPRTYRDPALMTYLPQFNFIPPSLGLKRVFSDFGVSYDDFWRLFPEVKGTHMAALSGGQRRLVETYVLLCSPSRFTLLDEPFTHLTPLHAGVMSGVMQEVKHRKGILITDHMYAEVTAVCDDLYLLAKGRTHVVKDIRDLETLGYISGK